MPNLVGRLAGRVAGRVRAVVRRASSHAVRAVAGAAARLRARARACARRAVRAAVAGRMRGGWPWAPGEIRPGVGGRAAGAGVASWPAAPGSEPRACAGPVRGPARVARARRAGWAGSPDAVRRCDTPGAGRDGGRSWPPGDPVRGQVRVIRSGHPGPLTGQPFEVQPSRLRLQPRGVPPNQPPHQATAESKGHPRQSHLYAPPAPRTADTLATTRRTDT